MSQIPGERTRDDGEPPFRPTKCHEVIAVGGLSAGEVSLYGFQAPSCARPRNDKPTAMLRASMSDTSAFKDAMARFPSGVVVATTLGPGGDPQGFTASSFCSVSLEPPLVLVCLSATARSHPAFEIATHFAISLLRPEHEPVARRFGTRGVDKFAGRSFEPGERGLPILRGALAVLICETQSLLPGGDHSILLGRPDLVRLGEPGPALVHHQRRFWTLGDAA